MPLSVNSFQPATQRFALSCGAAYLNDIQGFPDPAVHAALASSACQLIMMHSVQRTGTATRVITDPEMVMDSIGRFFSARLAVLQAAGISRDRLILDPGLGYFPPLPRECHRREHDIRLLAILASDHVNSYKIAVRVR